MLWTVATVTVVWLLQLQLLECSRRSALSAVSTSSLLSSSHTYEENNTSYAADVTYTGADAAKASNTATEKSATVRSDVDSSFYSRQLLVYGKSAQQKLQGGHVLLCGRGALLSETAKNLALAGVGKLTICVEERHQSALQNKERSLITNNQTLEEYARELNSQIEVLLFQELMPLFWFCCLTIRIFISLISGI